MELFNFPTGRALVVVALKDYLNIECQVVAVDLDKGDQRTPEYAAKNPNQKMPMIEDDGFVLWEWNAILFYLANKSRSGLRPSDTKGHADVLRWLTYNCRLFGRRTGAVGGTHAASGHEFSRNRTMVSCASCFAGVPPRAPRSAGGNGHVASLAGKQADTSALIRQHCSLT